MLTILAHSGHNHGTDPGLVALLVVVATLAALGVLAVIRTRSRS